MGQKSKLVKAVGTSFEIIKALSEQVHAIGGDDDDLRELLRDSELCRTLAIRLVMGPTYIVDVKQTTIADLIKVGRYPKDFVDQMINDQTFSIGSLGPRAIQLMNFSGTASLLGPYRMSTDALLEKIDEIGFRPATMAELLSLGTQYPKLQTQFWIAALGDIVKNTIGTPCVGCLDYNGYFRGVRMSPLEDMSNVRCWRFAAVAK